MFSLLQNLRDFMNHVECYMKLCSGIEPVNSVPVILLLGHLPGKQSGMQGRPFSVSGWRKLCKSYSITETNLLYIFDGLLPLLNEMMKKKDDDLFVMMKKDDDWELLDRCRNLAEEKRTQLLMTVSQLANINYDIIIISMQFTVLNEPRHVGIFLLLVSFCREINGKHSLMKSLCMRSLIFLFFQSV